MSNLSEHESWIRSPFRSPTITQQCRGLSAILTAP